MLRLIPVAIIVLASGLAAQSQQQTSENYCRYGLNLGPTQDFVDAANIYRNCAVGYSFIIPITHAHLVGEVCNFSRSMVGVSNYVACVVGNPRGSR